MAHRDEYQWHDQYVEPEIDPATIDIRGTFHCPMTLELSIYRVWSNKELTMSLPLFNRPLER